MKNKTPIVVTHSTIITVGILSGHQESLYLSYFGALLCKLLQDVNDVVSSIVTFLPVLTLTAALVGSQLIARVTGTLVAAQRVDTALLTATVVWLGALIHL